VTGPACSEAGTAAMTGATTEATGAMTGKTTEATGAMTGKTTEATGAMTGKTGVVAGPGCSGNRKLNDQDGHAAVRASGDRAARQRWRSSPDQNAKADLNAVFTPLGGYASPAWRCSAGTRREERSAAAAGRQCHAVAPGGSSHGCDN
jgi:hypothetical protein